MSRAIALMDWLEDKSDWLSPIVVKEVRQIVRSREFHYSFTAALVVALAIAFYGAATSIRNDGTSGAGTFTALMTCLTLLGMLVVPIGAFSALRTERMEQTLELVTVTALSARRVVIGKLMAQAVKLLTLFAAMAPFMTMSFLLGGIDFVTIAMSLTVLFLWSIWASSAFLFLSTLFKSRAMSGVVFGAAGIVVFFIMSAGRMAVFGFRGVVGVGGGLTGSRTDFWWWLAMIMTGCVATTMNFVLLAESRLAGSSENRVTPVRVGFFVQFLLIVAWALSYIREAPTNRANAAEALAVIGGLHLAMVAAFTVTESMSVPRRVLQQMRTPSRWNWLLALLRPGGGRGAAYVLAQMALLLFAAALLDSSSDEMSWRLAICAYICFFTGVPTYVWRRLKPGRDAVLGLRVAVLVTLALAVILPDALYNILWQPSFFDANFGRRHLLNPFRALANWGMVETSGWALMPALIGLAGLVSYLALMRLGAQPRAVPESLRATPPDQGPDGAAVSD